MAKKDTKPEELEGITSEAEPVADADEAEDVDRSEEAEGVQEDDRPSPKRQVTVRKKKKKVNMTSLITIIVCALIVLACFTYMAIKLDWIGEWFPSKANISMGDYSVIEVDSEYSSISDEDVQEEIDEMLADYTNYEDLAEGDAILTGDTVNIDYVGVYADSGEAFDGGSAEDYSYEVGSEGLLFDEDLVGLLVGSENEVPLTFPDDYSEESLQGVDTIFTITVNYATRPVAQEYNDEWCEEYSTDYLPEVLSTTDEFTEYFRNYYYEYNLHNEMFEYLITLADVKSYDRERRLDLIDYYNLELSYYASYYGLDSDTYALYMGFEDADAYNEYYAEYYLKLIMIIDYLCDDLGIEGTDEGLDNALYENLKSYGYADYYTVDEYKEACGDTWVMMFDALNYRYSLVMDALEDRVVFIEEETETE